MDKRRRKELWILITIAVLDICLVLFNNSTYDSGDSILHFLFSKQAFETPSYLLNHWAKPIFVLLSAPLAVLGWKGMQIFNSLCILLSSFYCFKLFEQFNLNKWFALIFCFAAPQFFLVQSSGLTEPLFTLFLIYIIYQLKNQNIIHALVVLSFLPFVRSEGWIIMPVIVVYLLDQKKLKLIPWIALGTLVYAILGLMFKGDFFWMFHQNPYTGTEQKYGSGQWLHYLEQLPYIIGFPLFFLFLLGIFDGFWRTMNKNINHLEFFGIYGITLAYILAHSIFWAEGLFHSYGLNRVLIVLVPLISFIAYRGLERLTCAFSFIKSKYLIIGVTALIVLFPFTENKASLGLPESYELEPEQELAHEVKTYTISKFGKLPIYYGNCYLPMIYGLNMDQKNQAYHIGNLKREAPIPHSLIIWDSYFSVTDQEIALQSLMLNPQLKLVKKFDCEDCKKDYSIVVFESR